MKIPLDLIEPGTRLRGVDQEHVNALAASIAEVGLLSPITVYKRKVCEAGIAVDPRRTSSRNVNVRFHASPSGDANTASRTCWRSRPRMSLAFATSARRSRWLRCEVRSIP